MAHDEPPATATGPVTFTVNGKEKTVDVDSDTPLLWVLRDTLGMTGTKFGCGMALCGACTVHLDGQAVRSCVLPVAEIAGKSVTTIEGIAPVGEQHPLQKAWVAENAPQCGYCQSGQIMSACAMLNANPSPSEDEIHACMSGNLCRCGTYPRIKKAILRVIQESGGQAPAPQGGAK